ncbi:phosphoenolpyruvate--protein phosphotransferase [bacterium]|nr:phosphoenolpyruvate--protein phosphotransferase [bacterium]
MLKGIAASPGIVIGRAFLLEEEEFYISKRTIDDSDMKQEIIRFRKALTETIEEMDGIRQKVLKQLGKRHVRLFDVYVLILEDPILRNDVIKMVTEQRVNAEYALQMVIDKITKTFNIIDDGYLRDRSRDILDVGKRVLKRLLGREREELATLPSPVIVVAHNLTPADTIAMRKENVIGFVTDIGGRTSHTVIMAQSLEIPAVVGLKNVTKKVKPGDTIIIDGTEGIVIINPDSLTVENYERQKIKYSDTEKVLKKLTDLPAVTADEHSVELHANIEVPEEIPSVHAHGATGIGLFRTEYIYLNRIDLPSEEEQYRQYASVAQKMMPYPVIIRTMDLGADRFVGEFGISPERNPFMGLRAIRLCFRYPHVFKTQLRAILRASVEGNLKIMYPMICSVEELRHANQLLEEVKNELRKEEIPFNENMEAGVMIETPSSALIADILAQEADFLSIGTNDLIQYTLAVDRVNENVAHLYKPLHLSILRLIKRVIDAGHQFGKCVGMCGEMAADPSFTKILLGMGLDELSMSPLSIPKIKNIIRSANLTRAQELDNRILATSTQEEVNEIIEKFEALP